MRLNNSILSLTKKLIAAGAAASFVLTAPAQSVPSLINYQGRLTDYTGAPLPVGPYTVQFRLWDSPTATGTNLSGAPDLIWGQQQNVTIQSNGVFNVILGSSGGNPIGNASPAVNNLAYAFGGSNCFLGVTVTASNGIAVADPSEIIPRQQLLTVPYAVSANVAASVLPGSITTASIAVGAIQSLNIATGAIQSTNIASGAVTSGQLAPPQVGTNVGLGGFAVSASSAGWSSPTPSSFTVVPNLTVTIATTGRPVLVMLLADTQTNSDQYSFIDAARADGDANYPALYMQLLRNGQQIAQVFNQENENGLYSFLGTPYQVFLDLPPAGTTNTYSLSVMSVGANGAPLEVNYYRLVAFEIK